MTGHKSAKIAQKEKALIIDLCNEYNMSYSETAATVIITHDDKVIEVKPKSSLITDKATNNSFEYNNAVARIMIIFNLYKQSFVNNTTL